MNKQQRTEAKLAKLHRNEQIVKLYAHGTSVRTIAHQLNTSQTTIFRVLDDNNIEFKRNHFTSATIKHAIALYNDPVNTIDSILQQTGIRSEQTLYRHLKLNNVPLRK